MIYRLDNHLMWAYDYCWIADTYHVPIQQRIIPENERIYLNYYQWVPLILLGQAFFFYLPVIYWRSATENAGVEITNVVRASSELQHGRYALERPLLLKIVVLHLNRYLTMVKPMKNTRLTRLKTFLARRCFLFCNRNYGNSISAMYLTLKFWCICNVLLQFVVLNGFLGDGYHLYGLRVIRKFFGSEHKWSTSERFPLVTMCDFDLRKPNENIQTHTVQCVLQINLFNEKIFIFQWFWLVFVLCASLCNIFLWIYRSCAEREKYRYVRHHLKSVLKHIPTDHKLYLRQFVDNFLKTDGILVMRIIGANGNDLVVAEILKDLWTLFKASKGLIPNVEATAPAAQVLGVTRDSLMNYWAT